MKKFFSSVNKVKNANNAFGFNQNKDGAGKKILESWVPGTAGITTTTVEISISCRNLADKDLLSKSDPMVVIYNRPPGSRGWIQFMRTEVIENDLNPDFAKKATMEYRFEQVQQLRFEVYDIDSKTTNLARQDKIGVCDVNLGQIVAAGDEGLIRELINLRPSALGTDDGSKPAGTIILTAEELASQKDEVHLKFGGSSLGSWSGFLPTKSFFVLSKINDARKYLVVHRSKPKRGSGVVTHIGETCTTLNKILKQGTEKIPLLTPTGKPCDSKIRVISSSVNPINTLIDFIQAGTQIHCCFAIDFTSDSSNGDPSDAESLHFLSSSGNQPNSYEQAITAVGNILKDYDNTSEMQAYGFGARVPPKGEISHNFYLTRGTSPNCSTLSGVLEAYRSCLSKVQLYGPTNFSPIIKTVAEMASRSKNGEHYYILTILTDGVITDLAETKKAIVQASGYPLSIVIIGVGEADFDAMQELDGDAVRLSYKGKVAERDIVQFVAYRSARSWMATTGECTGNTNTNKYNNDNSFGNQQNEENVRTKDGDEEDAGVSTPPAVTLDDKNDLDLELPVQPAAYEDNTERRNRLAQGQLAQEVLAEIPDQLRDYMRSKGIQPHIIKQKAQQNSLKNKDAENEKNQNNPAPAPQL